MEPRSHSEYLRTKRFPALDGLRALAIAAVVLHHAGAGGILGRGVLGVSVFFAISGFVITTILLRERSRTGTISLRGFHVRRALRIWPLYYAVLGLYAVLVVRMQAGSREGAEFFANLPYYATFTSNLFVDRGPLDRRVIFYFAWSLATQEQFYLLWPSIIRFSRRWWTPVAVMAGMLALEQLVRLAVFAGALEPESLFAHVATSVWGPICLGCLAAYALHLPGGFRALQPLVARPWSVPVAGGLAFLSLVHPDAPMLPAYAALVYLVLACALVPDGPWRRVLEHRAAVYVGGISYGIYLLHLLALNAARRILPGGAPEAQFAIAFPLVIAAAALSHRHLEQPFIRLKDRLAPVRRPAPALAAPQPPPTA